MAIRIIKENERHVVELEGSRFHYKRIPGHVRAEILKRHTPRRGGDPEWEKVLRDMLAHCLLDWENVLDDEGNPVPFSKDLVEYLPQDTQIDILDKLGANIPQLHQELGN